MWQVKSLTFCFAHLFPVKPQVCNAGANCSNPNLILCKIAFVSLVTVDIVNSISRTVVNIIVLCKGPSGLVTKLNKKKKKINKYFYDSLQKVEKTFKEFSSDALHGSYTNISF